MTTVATAQTAPRLRRLSSVMSLAQAALFTIAVGVFLTAPPSLPWVLAVIALTNVVFLAARSWMADARPPIGLLLINGLAVTLVIAYVAAMAAQH